ncbi:MAG: MAPEG family protein [Kofleriaceae bacterium]
MTSLQLVAFATVLTWVMILTAGLARAHVGGLKVAFGNRHEMPATQPAWIDRADRAAKNMLENLPLFIGLVAVTYLGNRQSARVDLGAHLFLWARLAYWPIYVAGIPVVRTFVWLVSIAGLALIFTALF